MNGHPDLHPLFEPQGPGTAERREILAHVVGCATCRADVARRDPSLLFSALALEPVPKDVLDRVTERAEAAIRRERQRRATRRLYAWGSLAASILVAGWLGVQFWIQRTAEPRPPSALEVVEVHRAAAPEAAIPAGMIELLESPGTADVVEMSVGDVEVVMIFDEAMKI